MRAAAGDVAVAAYNNGNVTATFTVNLEAAGIEPGTQVTHTLPTSASSIRLPFVPFTVHQVCAVLLQARVVDLWTHQPQGTVVSAFPATCRSHETQLYRVTPMP